MQITIENGAAGSCVLVVALERRLAVYSGSSSGIGQLQSHLLSNWARLAFKMSFLFILSQCDKINRKLIFKKSQICPILFQSVGIRRQMCCVTGRGGES